MPWSSSASRDRRINNHVPASLALVVVVVVAAVVAELVVVVVLGLVHHLCQ
jgi:hypothetical protein